MSMQCSDIESTIAAYLDGELQDTERSEVALHLAQCETCAALAEQEAQFLGALRDKLSAPAAPELLSRRLDQLLDQEDAAQAQAQRRQRLGWVLPTTASLAAAAALLLVVGSELSQPSPEVALNTPAPVVRASPVTMELATSQFRPSPHVMTGSRPELTRVAAAMVPKPVRPPRFADSGMDLQGVQQTSIGGRSAAMFVYKYVHTGVRANVRLYVFDANGMDLSGASKRSLGDRDLWLSKVRGVSAVSYKDENDVGYVFLSDMSSETLADLVERSDLTLLLPKSSESY